MSDKSPSPLIGSSHFTTHANAPHFLALLRARRERPRGGAAEQRDEFAPFQSIELHLQPLAREAA
jgi:hypothetical protein